jgi:hypothetical protein
MWWKIHHQLVDFQPASDLRPRHFASLPGSARSMSDCVTRRPNERATARDEQLARDRHVRHVAVQSGLP